MQAWFRVPTKEEYVLQINKKRERLKKMTGSYILLESLLKEEVETILKEGTKKAREKAITTMKEVQKAIGIDYFE